MCWAILQDKLGKAIFGQKQHMAKGMDLSRAPHN